MEKVHEIAYELHDKLLQSDEYRNLKMKENIMLTDKECSLLLNDYHKELEKYNFDKSDDNLKSMHLAKLKLDENLLVIEYKKAYKDYQILVGHITDIVFKDFKSDTLIDKIIKAK